MGVLGPIQLIGRRHDKYPLVQDTVSRPLLSSPRRGFIFLPPRPLRRRNGHQSLRILCSKCRGDEGRPGSFWPPSRPSSSAPCKAPGPASSSEVGRPVL